MPKQPSKARIVIICGPTGSGKTGVAVKLARHLAGDVIGADSMQVYRQMDIGTAKPTAAEQQAARHHMINVVDPDESFDAARYIHLARPVIHELTAAGRVPYVAGGTGLYIKALLYGLFEHVPVDPALRQRLQQEAQQNGNRVLHQRLRTSDPQGAAGIHPNDTYRIIRAMEILETTGQPLRQLHQAHNFADRHYDALQIGLTWDREVLYERIDARVDIMVAQGLLQEVRQLLAAGYAPDLKAMQSLGYRHMVAYINGDMTWDETLRTMKRDTRRYAKRQMTWFKADPQIVWKTPVEMDEITDLVTAFIKEGKPA